MSPQRWGWEKSRKVLSLKDPKTGKMDLAISRVDGSPSTIEIKG
jgi:hypothetical protein